MTMQGAIPGLFPLPGGNVFYGLSPAADARGSYIVPKSDVTLDRRAQVRTMVDQALVNTLVARSQVPNAAGTMLRDVRPHTDVGITDTSETWLVTGAGSAGTLLNLVPSTTLQLYQAVGFYGFELLNVNQTTAASVTQVVYLNQVGSIIARHATEQLEGLLEVVGYLSEYLIYIPQYAVQVQVMPRTGGFAANAVRVPQLSRFAEPLNQTIATPGV